MVIFFAKRILFLQCHLQFKILDTREGIPGLVIGTFVGQQGDVFTPFLTSVEP